MLYKLLEGAKEFQKKGMNVGDIRTKTILITKSSELKMVNVATSPYERTAVDYILSLAGTTTKYYLAP
jgi:hypothetical protein